MRAWDLGPAMSLLDLGAERWLGQRFDPEGGNASGQAHPRLLERWLDHPYFRLAPPKSTGREVFGPAWLDAREPDLAALPLPDRLATLAAFTAEAVARELRRLGSGAARRHSPAPVRGRRPAPPGAPGTGPAPARPGPGR